MFKKLFERYSKKTAIVIIALALVLSVGVTGTLAFLVAKTVELINVFNPGKITVTIDNINSTFTVSGDAKRVYARVAVVVNYQDDDGNVNYIGAQEDNHYTLADFADGWTKGSDGYYYYASPISVNAPQSLPVKVVETTLDNTTEGFVDPTSGGKYKLTVSYLVTAVQAEPSQAVIDAWGVRLTGETITTFP